MGICDEVGGDGGEGGEISVTVDMDCMKQESGRGGDKNFLTESDKKGFSEQEIQNTLKDVEERIREIHKKIKSLRERLSDAKKSRDAHEENPDAQRSYRDLIGEITKEMDSFRKPYIDLDEHRRKLKKELEEL